MPLSLPLVQGIRYLEAHRQEMQLPVYVVHGTKDAVTDMNVSCASMQKTCPAPGAADDWLVTCLAPANPAATHCIAVVPATQAVQAFVDGVSSTDKTFNKVDGGYHEMLMGEEKTGMAQGIIDWLRARIDKPWQQRQQAQEEEQGVQRVPAAAEGPSGAKL